MQQGLGHLYITSSRSYFFNETDFELYLFKFQFACGNLRQYVMTLLSLAAARYCESFADPWFKL